jgi:hypothetical protein
LRKGRAFPQVRRQSRFFTDFDPALACIHGYGRKDEIPLASIVFVAEILAGAQPPEERATERNESSTQLSSAC